MAVGLIVGIGVILLCLLGLLLLYLDRREQRSQKIRREKEETRRKEAEAREALFEDETTDPIERELNDE